jgi:hypothetical protein
MAVTVEEEEEECEGEKKKRLWLILGVKFVEVTSV